MNTTLPPATLIELGRMEEAMDILNDNLNNALNNGDADTAERTTAEMFRVAIAQKDISILKDIRVMRLELFSITNQKMKARLEFQHLEKITTKKELEQIKELTGFGAELEDEKAAHAQKPLLAQLDTYFIVDNVNMKNNGILNSVIRKTTLFEDEWGYRPTIVVSIYNKDIKKNINYLKFFGTSKVNTGVKVQNVYDYFQKNEDPQLPDIVHPRKKEDREGLEELEDIEYRESGPNTIGVFRDYGVFRDSVLIRTEYFTNPNNQLSSIVHVNENGDTTHIEYYDKKGYLSMIREMDTLHKNRYHTESYYTTEGKLCIKSKYIFKNNEHVLKSITVYDDDGSVLGEGTSEADLTGLYLDQVAAKSDKICLFVCESGLHNKAMASVNQKNAIKSAVVHNAFLEDSYNLKSKPQMFFKDLVRYQNRFDGIIILTKTECDDWIRIYGKAERVFNVPNFYPKPIEKVDFETRDHKKAVIVARFDNQKRLDIAVEVFKLVVEKVPDAKLEIYGFGAKDVEDKVQKLITKYSLQDNVFIMGSTDKPDEVCSGAACFMMTSSVEGMPLTLLESISNGCPIFSFDLKYGPADIVRNGKTGYLFPRGNIKAFAKQLVDYFKDVDMQREMSENAYMDAPRFGKEVFLENWYSFMEGVHENYLRKL